jgi:hypothetical protein
MGFVLPRQIFLFFFFFFGRDHARHASGRVSFVMLRTRDGAMLILCNWLDYNDLCSPMRPHHRTGTWHCSLLP